MRNDHLRPWAQVIKPHAEVLAEARGIACVEVDYHELRGIESEILNLLCTDPSGVPALQHSGDGRRTSAARRG